MMMSFSFALVSVLAIAATTLAGNTDSETKARRFQEGKKVEVMFPKEDEEKHQKDGEVPLKHVKELYDRKALSKRLGRHFGRRYYNEELEGEIDFSMAKYLTISKQRFLQNKNSYKAKSISNNGDPTTTEKIATTPQREESEAIFPRLKKISKEGLHAISSHHTLTSANDPQTSTTFYRDEKKKEPHEDNSVRNHADNLPTLLTRKSKRSPRSLLAESGKNLHNSSGNLDPRITVCETKLSCKNKCHNPPSLSFSLELICYCDHQCEQFVDCCADYEHFCKLNATGNFTISKDNISMNSYIGPQSAQGSATGPGISIGPGQGIMPGPPALPGNRPVLVPKTPNQPSPNMLATASPNTTSTPVPGMVSGIGQGAMPGPPGDKGIVRGGDPYAGTTQAPVNVDAPVEPKVHWSCEKIGKQRVWMINKCPDDYQIMPTKQRCEFVDRLSKKESVQDLLDARPVYTNDGKVYKNHHCAYCSGLHEQDLKVYDISYDCDVSAPESMAIEQKLGFLLRHCGNEISWVIPSGSPRRLCFEVESCSNLTHCGDRCSNGTVGIVSRRSAVNLRNSFCSNEKHFLECGPVESERSSPYTPPPFSITFNFEGNGRWTSGIKCRPGLEYNPDMETCEQGFSSFAPLRSNIEKYRVLLWVRLDFGCSVPNETIASVLHQTFSASWSFSNIKTTHELRFLNIDFDVEPREEKRERKRRDIAKGISFDRVLHFSSPFSMIINGTECEVFKATARILSCSDLRQYNQNEYTPLLSGSVYINSSGEVFHARYYYTNGTNVTTGPIHVCHAGRRESICSGVFSRVEQFTIFPNQSIYVEASARTYNKSEYFVDNGATFVCTDLPPRREKTWADDPALSWLTLMCMLLSIAGLVFFLVTYLLFSELRTIPGVNLMNLGFSTLLAQVTWLTGVNQTDKPVTCTIVAASLQYFYLVSFMWTSIIAYDTWRAFSSNGHRASPGSRSEKSRKCLRYMALGWLPCLMFVVICVSLDQTGIVDIGYGFLQFCWMANGLAIVYIFAIPVALAIIVDAVFYGLTVKAIKTTASQAQMAAENSKRRGHFGIYVRLASVMGFTWVFGFGAALLWSPLWYVFVPLNCLQGVYIAAAFALSDQAKRLYRELLGIKADEKRNTSTKSATEAHDNKIDSTKM